MPSYKAPLRDMQFLLQDVFRAAQFFASMQATSEMTSDVSTAVLEEAARICETLLSPLNQPGDETGCRHENGRVITPPGFVEAYQAFAQGGWVGFIGDPEFGGQGMPKMLSVLLEEMLMGSNPSFGLYPILTSGASLALSLHGTNELKQAYLPNLYNGRWSATMCLTEAHAGSDLGIIRTRAVPHQDGSFRLAGTKIFITAGEHDLTDNIIHFVLAKLPDAPAGSRGISLFLVPRILDEGKAGAAGNNGVSCASIEHKMGLKASATCVMNFENSKGFLVGEINKGLACMFTMMNYERLSMGLQGIGLAQNSYHSAVSYARDRMQGRSPEGTLYPEQIADPIIVHPDVRRMLLTMRANIVAGRALGLYVAGKLDIAKFHASEAERFKASELVEFLTPVAKAYLTDRGFEACVIGQQVFGGHGYIREWGMEQLVRDARIAQIYEGTNGIQALDLAGRKTVRSGGFLLQQLEEEIAGFIKATSGCDGLHQHLDRFQRSMNLLRECTNLMVHRASGNNSEIGAAAYPYMELLGLNCFAYMWLRILASLQDQETCARYEPEYLDGMRKTADFFMLRLLPRGQSLAEEIKSGSDVLMRMKAEQF